MAALNIMCSICMEFYKVDSIVVTTMECGHLFHRTCINHWLKNAQSCPKCCKHLSQHRLRRVYLDFSERTQADDELDERFKNYPNWVPLEDLDLKNNLGEILQRAIQSGTDEEGHQTYVARVYFKDSLQPGNYVPEKGGAYVPWGCQSHFLNQNIELLLDCECKWIEDSFGHVPADAIQSGYSEQGETLYTGRGKYEDKEILGKVQHSHRVLYMPHNTREVNVNTYEVLVQIKDTTSTDEASSSEVPVPMPPGHSPPQDRNEFGLFD